MLIQTRFLWLLHFTPGTSSDAARALCSSPVLGRQGVWRAAEPAAAYQEELLDHVGDFLFAHGTNEGCYYLKVADAAADSWIHDCSVQLTSGHLCPFELVAARGIELFLTPYGAAALCVTVTTDDPGGDWDRAIEFNYRLARLRHGDVPRLRRSHPTDSPVRWSRLSDKDRVRIGSMPDANAPLEQRIGKPGGAFQLPEFLDALLKPLTNFGSVPVQDSLGVYSVVRFGEEIDLANTECIRQVSPFLCALAQVEEPGHAGAAAGDVALANAMLNRRHWVAVGMLGAAHLVADQSAPEGRSVHPYNEQRAPRIRDKYFIPFLVALLERSILHRIARDAARLARQDDSDPRVAMEFKKLRRELLRFSVGGHFTQVSSREAIHRYYRTVRSGLDLDRSWREVRRAITEINDRYATQRQQEIAEQQRDIAESQRELAQQNAQLARQQSELAHSTNQHMTTVARVQVIAEWIEVFILSVYCAHLWYMISHGVHGWVFGVHEGPSESLRAEAARISQDSFTAIGVLVFAALGLGLGFLFVKWMHRRFPH